MRSYILSVVFLILNLSCSSQDNLTGRDVRLYENTPVWQAAVAIRDKDYARLRKILAGKPASFADFRETRFMQSLLYWAVYRDDLEATKILADAGADPNLKAYDSTSAFIHAAGKAGTSEYLRVLLKHGGNVNAVADIRGPQHQRTPLIAAAYVSLENVKLLADAGADVNFVHSVPYGDPAAGAMRNQSALISACMMSQIDIVEYLIFEKKVKFDYVFGTTYNGKPHSILYYLREMTFKLDSEDHKKKMRLVDFLKSKGLNYWNEPIPAEFRQSYNQAYLDRY